MFKSILRKLDRRRYTQSNTGKSNPADILSKHFAYADVRPLLEPIMFWKGVGPEYTEHLDVPPKSKVKSNLQDKGEYQKSKSSGLAKSRKLKLD